MRAVSIVLIPLCCYQQSVYLLTPWSRVLLEKLTSKLCPQVKKFPAFMEPESSSPYPQVPATCPYPSNQYSDDKHRHLYGNVVVCHHVLEPLYCLCDPVCVASGNLLYSRGSRECYWDILWLWIWGDLDCWGICRVLNVAHVEHPRISLTFRVPISFFIFTVLPWSCEVGFGTCCTRCKHQQISAICCNTYVMTAFLFLCSYTGSRSLQTASAGIFPSNVLPATGALKIPTDRLTDCQPVIILSTAANFPHTRVCLHDVRMW